MVGFRCDRDVEQEFPTHRVRGSLQPMLPKYLACPGISDCSPLLLASVLKSSALTVPVGKMLAMCPYLSPT